MLQKLLPRKRIFVSGRIQGQLVFRLGTYWILYHFVLWHALFAYHFLQLRMAGNAAGATFREVYGTFVLQYYPIILCAIGMLPIFLIDLVRLSHRIAGPLVRFSTGLRGMIAGGEVRRVRLRKGDLMTDFETVFNEYVDVYEVRRRERINREKLTRDEADRVAAIVKPQSASPLQEATR